MKSIFISHSSQDEKIVSKFVDEILIGSLAVKITDIFCTTMDGTKIKSGRDWRDEIKSHLENAKITFLIITPHYKESEVCLNEMGAAWVSSATVIPLIVDPINYLTVGVIQQPKQVEKLLDESSLDRVKDIIQEELRIPAKNIKSDRWTKKKIKFITEVKNHIKGKPFSAPLVREEYEILLDKNIAINELYQDTITENQKLKEIIEELKKVKDHKAIIQILKKHSDSSMLEKFQELVDSVYADLKPFVGIVTAMIFSSYSGKSDIKLDYEGWDSEIAKAVSNDYITEDFEPDWETTREMRDLYSSLSALKNFMAEVELDDDFISEYENEYKATFSINNLKFWSEVFNRHVAI